MVTKENNVYGLTLDSSVFLDKRSPAYLGGATEFLCDPKLTAGSKRYSGCSAHWRNHSPERRHHRSRERHLGQFRAGDGADDGDAGAVDGRLADPTADRPLKILDIAAGHGLYGLAFATKNPQVEITCA